MSAFSLTDLEVIVAQRAQASDPSASWTAKLLSGGTQRVAKKLGEEAVETVIAAIEGDRAAIVSESADLIYHWMVLLASAGIPLAEVMAELERRTSRSGLAEKAARNPA